MEDILKLNFLTDIDYFRLCLDIILLFVCTKVIEYTYKKYSYSNDNKNLFASNLFNFVLSIFLIVSVIKTSIALSLGLVGALSIIRFRTAIKEPGQLVILLILTALSISVAAEKEILGILGTIVFYVHLVFSKKSISKSNDDFSEHKILRISLKNSKFNISNLLANGDIERLYKDDNGLTHIEYKIANDIDKIDLILDDFKKQAEIISYEII